MAELTSFRPMFVETVDRVRARINGDANPGLAPTDAGYLDTTPGGFFFDITQAPVLEITRLWDALNEYAAAIFLPYSWGVYLDNHGATLSIPRKDAAAATGTVTFNGPVGTFIATGTEVATQQVSADADPLVFRTTASATIPASGTVDVPVESVAEGATGNVPAGAVTVLLSPVVGISAIVNTQAVTGGADIENDEAYRSRLLLAYAGAHGAGTLADYQQWGLSYPGVGFVTVDPLWNGPGTVRVIVTDVNNNPVSQAVIDGLQNQLDPYSAISTLVGPHTLPTPTITLLDATGYLPAGQIYIGDQLISYTSRSSTQLQGSSGGAGTFPNGTRVTQSGLGHGQAPIGAQVTVATPATLNVNVTATITPEPGSTLTGVGGTVEIGDAITEAITTYIDSLSPGEDVILQAIVARIMDVSGVHDVSAVTINGVAGNLVLGALQVAQTGAVTLS